MRELTPQEARTLRALDSDDDIDEPWDATCEDLVDAGRVVVVARIDPGPEFDWDYIESYATPLGRLALRVFELRSRFVSSIASDLAPATPARGP